MAMRRRRGFTLIELLMVAIIIAVLIALLLPAVQSAREAARNAQCRNNLLQLGIALGNYASTHRVFPPGVVNDKGPIANWPKGYHMGWAVQILPFLEQANLYRQIDFRHGVYDKSNATVLASGIRTFLCPSDGRPGPTSYMGCHHDVEAPIDANNRGVLYLNSHVSYDDLNDGPSYTILLGEARGGPSLGWASGTRASLRNMGHSIGERDSLVPPQPGWWYGGSPTPPAPGEVEALVQGGLLPQTYVGGFSSWHPAGANFLLCDGSARFIKQTIDRRVLQRLGNRSDGEIVGDDDF
jgi:prepilin-type N-terminal cleavage/methylation domain-containing protein/prepilin-type processing-associated H-X9-DG protein